MQISKIKKIVRFKHSKSLLLTIVLMLAISLSLVKLLWASTPNPGHPWSQIGDGTFSVTGPSTNRVYTFPDADTTVLTTNALVSVSQGGTGTSTLSGILIGNGTNPFTSTTSPSGLLVGTSASQTLSNKTLNASDNTITDTSTVAGDLLKSNGSKFVRFGLGSANQVLRTNASGDDLEWASISSGPGGADTQIQYNNSGAFAGSANLTWSQSDEALKVNGSLVLATSSVTGVASTNTLRLFNQPLAGKGMLGVRTDEASDYYVAQPSIYQNFFVMWVPNHNGFLAIGTAVQRTSTNIPPTDANVISEAGFFVRITTDTTTDSVTADGETTPIHYRGSMAGRNGYFYFSRLSTDSSVSSIHLWTGLTSASMTNTLGSNDAAGNRVGFVFNTGLSDTNWMFETKDNSTANRNSTGIAVAANKVYDFYFYNAPQGSTVYWRIDNLTDGTSADGSSSSNLPIASTALRGGYGVRTLTSAAKSLQYQKVYIETPR